MEKEGRGGGDDAGADKQEGAVRHVAVVVVSTLIPLSRASGHHLSLPHLPSLYLGHSLLTLIHFLVH